MSLANNTATANSTQDIKNTVKPHIQNLLPTNSIHDLNANLNSELEAVLQGKMDVNIKLSARECIAHCFINQCVVALGSNFRADKHLAIAREEIEQLAAQQYWSTAFLNPDYTATPTHPKPDYTNQCGYLKLSKPQTLQQFIEASKRIETSCQRIVLNRSDKVQSGDDYLERGRVSIDIDVLAVRIDDKWHIIKQRYPFKEHEIVGLKELLQH